MLQQARRTVARQEFASLVVISGDKAVASALEVVDGCKTVRRAIFLGHASKEAVVNVEEVVPIVVYAVIFLAAASTPVV